MIKAILFDLGGVIYKHPKNVIPHVLASVYKIPLKKAIDEYAKYRLNYFTGRLATNNLIANLNRDFHVNKPIAEIKELWLKYYKKLAIPDRNMLRLLRKLRKNYRVILFTNTTQMNDLFNNKSGIYNYFDDLFLTFKMGVGKPEVASFNYVLRRIKFKPEECLFIDDKEDNINAASKLSFQTILFNILKENAGILEQKLKELGVGYD